MLGEDLTRFRNTSKILYNFLRTFSWNDKVERLGFDEVWMDVSDIVRYNADLLNKNEPECSFFQLSREDPTLGFDFDATRVAGKAWTQGYELDVQSHSDLEQSSIYRNEHGLYTTLLLGSHLAQYLRHKLAEIHGYTSTVGISTSKLVSKLVGNVNKPCNQTTMLPPYTTSDDGLSNITAFIDSHDIGSIPWVGFKIAQKIRQNVLQRPPKFDDGLVYGATRESITVGEVRRLPELTPASLQRLLAGPGIPHGIGTKVFGLLHGIDDAEVIQARNVPRQISIEDSYVRLDTMDQILKELHSLTKRLIRRMRVDLADHDNDSMETKVANLNVELPAGMQWIAKPKDLRLTTRPRPPLNADGTRPRSFKRISRSAPLPSFVLDLAGNEDMLTERLVSESLVPLFKKLHPEKGGWNLSLVNIAVTNMMDTGSNSKKATGRDIAKMLLNQNDVLSDFSVKTSTDQAEHANLETENENSTKFDGHVSRAPNCESIVDPDWSERSSENEDAQENSCSACGQAVPDFAIPAHQRYHAHQD